MVMKLCLSNWLGRLMRREAITYEHMLGKAVEFEGRRKCLTFSVLGLVFIG